MYNNPLSGEAIVNIVNDMLINSTKTVIWLPKCPEGFKTKFLSRKLLMGTEKVKDI